MLYSHQHGEFEYIDDISLEKVISLLSENRHLEDSVKSWSKDYIFTSGDQVTNSTDLGTALKEALNLQNDQQKKIDKSPKPATGNVSDVMTIEEELALYPEETLKSIQQHKATVQQEAIHAVAQEQIFEEVQKALNLSKKSRR